MIHKALSKFAKILSHKKLETYSNQGSTVLRKIEIAVENNVKKWVYISLR